MSVINFTTNYSGGGIGGLTLAVALSRLGLEDLIEVDIYESAPELTQVGAGITFWPRAWKILRDLGLEEALIRHLSPGQHVPDGKPSERREYLSCEACHLMTGSQDSDSSSERQTNVKVSPYTTLSLQVRKAYY